MDFAQTWDSINYVSVFVAALSAFVIGGLWYSVLFSKAWMIENGFDEESLKNSNMGLIFGGSFVFSFIISIGMALMLGSESGAMDSATTGFLIGLLFVATAMGITYLFERKSLKLFFINAGYQIITFTVIGLILGLWR
jgi:hypothetical protein